MKPAADREALIDAFLAATPWREATRTALTADASFRRYHRLRGGPRPALLMDAPPPMEDVRPFVTVARHLETLGFSAPEIWAEDRQAGLLVIEDFGDETYTRRLAAGGDEAALYRDAVDVLVALHRHPDAAAVALPAYDRATLLDEVVRLLDWYYPAMFGADPPADLKTEFEGLWQDLFPLADAAPPTIVLRDYHVDNLMCLDGRPGVAGVGLLDFQDAVIGPPAYDLVSLLEDARRDVPADLGRAMMDRYVAAFPGLDAEAFRAGAAMLAAQRSARIIGQFTRLLVRDGKPVYLRHIPRVWRWLEQDLTHPALAPMKAWIDRVFPPEARRVPDAGESSRQA